MSSQHDDYVAYHNTVNAQNRSNYEVKYRLIGQIPTVIIAISTLYNAFLKNNWHWGIGVLSLGAIVCSLITYMLLYYLLESSNSVNEQLLEISAKNQNLPPNEQLKAIPAGKDKYDRLNKYTRRVCVTSIFFCILLTFTTGVTLIMSEKDKNPQTTTNTFPQTDNDKGIVTRPILPDPNTDPNTIDEGVVTPPIEPVVNPTPPPEQPATDPPPSADPPPEPPPADKPTE